MSRITSLSSSLTDMLVLLADGNPGAISAMVELAKSAETIDPDSALGAFGPILSLDTHEIYGSHIWIFFKDICGQKVERAQAVLRAVQLGIASDGELKRAIAAYHFGADRTANEARVDELFAAVRECLPRFASADTHPKDGDGEATAPLVSGAVLSDSEADAQNPLEPTP